MKITPFQERNLRVLLLQKEQGLSLGRLLLQNRALVFGHVVILVGACFYLGQGGVWAGIGCGLIGFALGSLIRMTRTYQSAVNFWPVSRELIDWEKARALLEQAETDAAEGKRKLS